MLKLISILIYNTVPDNYAIAKVVFLHPSKLHTSMSKNSNMPYNDINYNRKILFPIGKTIFF